MSTIKDVYRDKFNKDVYSDDENNSYSDEYVRWLESQLATDGREELEKENERLRNLPVDEFVEMKMLNISGMDKKDIEIGYQETKLIVKDAIVDALKKEKAELQSQCTEKEKECEVWKNGFKEMQQLSYKSGDKLSMKNRIIEEQSKALEELKAEKERLKGIIKEVFYGEYNEDDLWEDFKTENNL